MTGASTPEHSPPRDTEISVVIPAYNYAAYLPETIRSVQAQTYRDFEIVIVDDGSTDDTAEVVRPFLGERVRCVRQENAGLSAARNTGIRESRGRFVAFLDADDQWEPGLLAEAMQAYAELTPDYGLVATNSSRIDSAGTPLPAPKRNWDTNREYTARDFCMRNRPLSSSIVARREVFEKAGDFDTKLRSSEDRDMWIRATEAGFRFWFIHQPLCRIRRHAGNMSKHAPRMHANSLSVLEAARARGAVAPGEAAFWRKVFAVHYQQVATTHFDAGLRLAAFGYLARGIALWPWFSDHRAIGEPWLFRARTAVHFLRGMLGRSKA